MIKRISLASASAAAALALVACTSGPTGEGQPPPAVSPSPSSATQQADDVELYSYEFAPGSLVLPDRGGRVPTRVNAILAMPPGPGPHPTAFLFHASLPRCMWIERDQIMTTAANTVRWEEGCPEEEAVNSEGLTGGHDYLRAPASYGYLAAEMASRGIATVVFDLSAKELMLDTDPLQIHRGLYAVHRDLVTDLNEGRGHGLSWAEKVAGRFDLGRIVWVGHSSGASMMLTELTENPVPGLQAAVAIEPAVSPGGNVTQQARVPTLMVIGSCDEQVGAVWPRKVAREIARANPGMPVGTAELGGTTHLGLLEGAGSKRVSLTGDRVNESESCQESALPGQAAMRAQAARVVADFLEGILAGVDAIDVGIGPAIPVTLKSFNGLALQPTPVPAGELPQGVAPDDFTFEYVEKQFLAPTRPQDWPPPSTLNEDGEVMYQ